MNYIIPVKPRISLVSNILYWLGAGDETGIGAATALHMVQFGPRFVLTGRHKDRLDNVGKLMKDAGVNDDKVSLMSY